MNILLQIIHNPSVICILIVWNLAQFLKIPVQYMISHRWEWDLFFRPGGMPSSHSALVAAAATSIGLFNGFDTPAFTIALATAMIVIYDAAGVRRQAGYHAEKINLIIAELFSGQPISEERLKEVIGHSPRQVFVGTVLGILIALVMRLLWRS
jgi:acid phosphatase family membrane protein YuiD